MSRGKKKRRRGHFEQKVHEFREAAKTQHRAYEPTAAEKREKATRLTTNPRKGQEERNTNPYQWDGDILVRVAGGFDGPQPIATIDDFPQIRRARELNARANAHRRAGIMGRELFVG